MEISFFGFISSKEGIKHTNRRSADDGGSKYGEN
jgi:hypothetical protein